MSIQTWKRIEYETWDAAFRGLAPVIRQQSVRVADYTQVLFTHACSSGFGKENADRADRMKGQYADLAYKCGLYHQLGKALVPPEYQIFQKDFTEEEQALYRKYTSDGRILIANLQERTSNAKAKRRGTTEEVLTQNIPWLMLRESCQQHMECWDGSGFPEGRKGLDISPIAQIVGLAKQLDSTVCERKSEHPFEEGFAAVLALCGTRFAPQLSQVLEKAKEDCKTVYNKYVDYTRTLPETIPLIRKTTDRPMGLVYRPLISGEKNTKYPMGYEAICWFGGIAGNSGETEPLNQVEELLKRTKLTAEMENYFLYEATDAMLRIQNCQLPQKRMILQMMAEFYTLPSQLKRFDQLYKDQPVERTNLILTIPAAFVATANKGICEIIARYNRNSVVLLLDGYMPEQFGQEKIDELGFRFVRFERSTYLKPETAAAMKAMQQTGIEIIGGDADSDDVIAWLHACGCRCISGPFTGKLMDEETLIRDALALENSL